MRGLHVALWAFLVIVVAAVIIGAVVMYSNDCGARGGQVIVGQNGVMYCVPELR
jgi:hypothetical protein